ncbi:hypothetical protein IPV08_10640 [Methylobacterium sp. SD274]|uniref:hypothetical protein n=1 Tax=Methylobacterium sp. SD274 TaxID=2782009 RepID=UPI001A95796C|nr:hypothetical protein [Methylobacterium sp. SD274]MBO1020425.1 hypothetical protein [Methylobacterium sp. SD274]
MPPFPVPPLALGMTFAQDYEHTYRRGTALLWTSRTTSPAFILALAREPARMRAAGYVHFIVGDRGMTAVWWPENCKLDDAEIAALQADVDALVAAEAAAVIEAAAAREAALAKLAAATRARAAALLPRLADLVSKGAWQLGRSLPEATQLVGVSPLPDSSAWRVCDLVSKAEATRTRAEARLRQLAPEAWLRLAADPDVRAAALEGCRILSALDGDRASKRNGEGWGQDDTGVGHLLAERKELTEREAAHALRLLHHHRRQLPVELRSRAFDAAIQPDVPAL